MPKAYCPLSDRRAGVAAIEACAGSVGERGAAPGFGGAESVARVIPMVMRTTESYIVVVKRSICFYTKDLPLVTFRNVSRRRAIPSTWRYIILTAAVRDRPKCLQLDSPPDRKIMCIGTGTLRPNAQLFMRDTARKKMTCTIHRRSGTTRCLNLGIQLRFVSSPGGLSKVN
jgi:hypothetical protein